MIDLVKLENIIGVKFVNQKLLRQALIHRSYLNENRIEKFSNERLEFLGDSVLSLLVSTAIYKRFENYPEGKLTSLRSLLVKTKTLAALAEKIKLGEFLLMSRGEETSGGRSNTSLLADCLEAVIGAIYLDSGSDEAQKFLEKILFPLIPKVEHDKKLLDYKSTLQEITQEKHKTSPIYEIIAEKGPDHDKTFKIGVRTNGAHLGIGTGKSKQDAEQDAARVALAKLKL